MLRGGNAIGMLVVSVFRKACAKTIGHLIRSLKISYDKNNRYRWKVWCFTWKTTEEHLPLLQTRKQWTRVSELMVHRVSRCKLGPQLAFLLSFRVIIMIDCKLGPIVFADKIWKTWWSHWNRLAISPIWGYPMCRWNIGTPEGSQCTLHYWNRSTKYMRC